MLAESLTTARLIDDLYPPEGTTTVFSPRSKMDALELYARQAGAAKDALFT